MTVSMLAEVYFRHPDLWMSQDEPTDWSQFGEALAANLGGRVDHLSIKPWDATSNGHGAISCLIKVEITAEATNQPEAQLCRDIERALHWLVAWHPNEALDVRAMCLDTAQWRTLPG